MHFRPTLAVLLAVLPLGPAVAAAVPQPVETMLREAAKSPEALGAVAAVAKAAYPDSAAEIDLLLASLKTQAADARETRLNDAGVLDSWSGSASLGVSRSTGNTNETAFTAAMDIVKDGVRFRHKVKAQGDHQIVANRVTRNRYLATYELEYKFSERLFAFGLGGWDRDTFSGFSRRFSESAGLGYAVVRTPSMTLSLTGGPAFRQTRFITGASATSFTGRAGIDYAWRIHDRLTFTEVAAIYVGDGLNSTSALTGRITETLSARASFELVHEDQLPAGRKATDSMTRFALVLGF